MSTPLFFALSQSPEGASGQGGGIMMFLPFALIMLVFWFLIIKPQRKQQKQRQEMLTSLKKGDRIVTSGGLFATILNIKEDRLVVTISDGVKVEVARSAVGSVVETGDR